MVQQKKRLTLNDVAKHAGVSRATASLVVRGSSKIKEQTAAKVEQAMKDLGYVYDRMAANMRSQTSTTVGLIITDIGNPFFTDLLKGVHSSLEESGYTVFLGTTFDSEIKQKELIERMLEHRVAGIILCPVSGISSESAHFINNMDIPVVMAVREVTDINHDYVGIDYEAGALMATNHLIQKGHRKIAFVGGMSYSVAWQRRMDGFKKALEQANIPYDQNLVLETVVSREAGKEAVLRLLATDQHPTAIFCFNDLVAHGVMLGLQDAKLVVGKDIAVVGFDNTNESSWYYPSLTTVSSFPKLIGSQAASLLHQRILNQEGKNQRIILQPELNIRQSSKNT